MGITKNHIYTQNQIEMARLLKAIAHPARLAIIENLLAHPNSNCNDLRNYIQLAQSTISGHIKELHSVGILSVKVIGSNAYYEVNRIAVDPITVYLDQLYDELDKTVMSDRLMLYTRTLPYIVPPHFRNQAQT